MLEPVVEQAADEGLDRWAKLILEMEEKEKHLPKNSYYYKRREPFYKLGYNENIFPIKASTTK